MAFGFIAALIAIATSAGVYYQQKKMEAQARKQANEAKAVQLSGHDSNRGLYTVYGKTLVGSTVVWKKVSDKQARITQTGFTTFSAATGSDLTTNKDWDHNRWLYRAVTLCNGPVESVTNVTVDDESYESPRFTNGADFHFATSVSLGPTAGQNFSALRNAYASDFATWDSNAVGKGVAYAMERMYLSKNYTAFQGEPQTRYLVKGRKVYDPRKDSTSSAYDSSLGVSSHRADTDSTWQWSDNPVICLLDYLRNEEYGRGLPLSVIDIASIAAAADKCDVLVDVPAVLTNDTGSNVTQYDPATGITYITTPLGTFPYYRPDQETTGTNANKQKRFRLNIAVDPAKEILENIQEILNVFRGNLSYANGKYIVHMADVQNPVLTLGDDDIIGGLKIANGDRSQRMNRATVKFINENKQHKTDQISWPSIDSNRDGDLYATYLSQDEDEKLHRTFTVKGCTDFYQAQDTAEFLVRDSRSNLTVTGTFGSRCFGLVPGDVISLTYDSAGFSGKYFRVLQANIDLVSMNVQLQLKEYDSSVYTWNSTRANEPLGLSWQEEVVNAAPTSPTIGTITTNTRTQGDDSARTTLTIAFSGVPEDAQYAEISWAINGTNDYNTQLIFDTANQTSVEVGIDRDGQTYEIRLRYFAANDFGTLMPSAYATTTHAVASLTGTKLDGIATGATANTGALADLDSVDTAQIEDNAVNIDKLADAIQSTNYSAQAGSEAGWRLTTDGTFTAQDGNFRGGVTATSGTFAGSVNVNANGKMYGGSMTSFNNGTGFFLGYHTDAYKFSVGDSNSKVLTWDGDNLNVQANVVSFTTGGEPDYDSNSRFPTSMRSSVLDLGSNTAYVFFDNKFDQNLTLFVSYYAGPLTSGSISGETNAKNAVMSQLSMQVQYAPNNSGSPGTWTNFGGALLSQKKYTSGQLISNYYVKTTDLGGGNFRADLATKSQAAADFTGLGYSETAYGITDEEYYMTERVTQYAFPKGEYFFRVVVTVTDGSYTPYPASGSPSVSNNRRLSIPNALTYTDSDHGQSAVSVGNDFTYFTSTNDNQTLIDGGSISITPPESDSTSNKYGGIFIGGRGANASYFQPLGGIWFYEDMDDMGQGAGSDGSPDYAIYMPTEGGNLVISGNVNFNHDVDVDGTLSINGVTVNAGAVTGPAGSDGQIQYNNGGALGGSSNLTFDDSTNTLSVTNLTVSGTTTTIDTTNLNVSDKNITLNYGTGDTSANADGAGITIQDAVDASTDATILWDATNDEFDFSHGATFAGRFEAGDIAQFKRDVRVNGIIRATGWYSDAADTDYTGLGVEMGVSGSQPYIIAYDRDNTSYSDLYFNATDYFFQSQPTSAANAKIATFQSNNSSSAYIQVESVNTGANYAYLELKTASTVSGSPIDRGYLIKNREDGTGNSVAAGSLYLYNETGPIDLIPNSTQAYRTTVGTDGQLVVRSSNDAPITAESTDAFSGIQFVDADGNDYLFYNGSTNHYYTNSGKMSIAGSSIATGYEFQVNGDANITGRIEANAITTDDDYQVRLASTAAGYFNSLPKDQETGYMNFGAGAFGLLFRNGYDSYITNNAYYYRTNNVSNWYGKFSSRNAGLIEMYDGKFVFRNTNGTDVTSGQSFSFTTQMEISETGNVTIQGDLTSNGDVTGDSFHTENGWIDSTVKNSIQVIGDNKSPFMFRNSSYNNVFSSLPWSGGNIYLTFGGYHNGSEWIERSNASTPYLSLLHANAGGMNWYYTTAFNANREVTSWNIASSVSLWNEYGAWDGDINTSSDIDVGGMVSTGRVSASEFDLPSGGMIDWANGDARIIEGQTENFSLSFQTYNGSALSTALRLDGDNTAHFFGPAHIIGNGSYVGNYGYSTLILEDTAGYPGLNFREGNYNWLQRKNGQDHDMEFVYSSNASAQGTGNYYPKFTIHSGGGVNIHGGDIDTNGGDVDAGSGIFNSDSGVSVFAGAKVNAGGMYVHGGGTYSDPGSQMFLHTDSSGYGRLAVYDMRFLVGENSARTIQALRLESDGEAFFYGNIHTGQAQLFHNTDNVWRGLTIQNNGDTNQCTVDGKSSDGTQQFVVYGGSQSQGFLHPTAYTWRFKVPLTGSLQRDNAYDIFDAGNYPTGLSFTGDTTGSATISGSTGTKAIGLTTRSLTSVGQYVWKAGDNPSQTSGTIGYAWHTGITTSFVRSADGYPSYGSVIRVKNYPNDGGAGELYFPYNATYGGNHLRFRLGLYNNAGMTSFRDVIDSSNYHQIKQGDFSADAFKWQGNSAYYFDPNPAVTTGLRIADSDIDMRGVTDSDTDTGQIILGAYNGPSAENGTTQGPAIVWKPNYSGYTKESLKIAGIAKASFFDMDMVFYTNGNSNTGGGNTERFRLTQEGTAYFSAPHVGINTTVLGNTAWGSTSNTGQLTLYGSNYGVINLKGAAGTSTHYSMGGGNDRFYMAYRQGGYHSITVYQQTVGLGSNNTTPNTSYSVDIAGDTLIDDGQLVVTSSATADTMIELGTSTQTLYTNQVWYSNSGDGEIWKSGTAHTSWGGSSSFNIYNSNGNINFHPVGTANQFIIRSSYCQVDQGLRAKATAGGNYGPMFSANGKYAQASVGHTATNNEGIFWHLGGNSYAIYHTAGTWTGNTYQQLRIDWPTGIILGTENDGTYAKSYIDVNSAIYADEAIHAPIYYDQSGTSYYLDLANTGDSLRVAGNVVAYYSDERLKDIEGPIQNALESVNTLEGFYYTPNEKAQRLGYKKKREVGLSAQSVQAILPEVVTEAPVDPEYLTVDYARLVPLLVESIKELTQQVKQLQKKIEDNEK